VTEPDAAVFDAKLDPEVLHFGETKPQATVCPWCGEGLPTTDLEVCPHCGALLKPSDEAAEVPGVTTLSPEAVRMLEVAEEKRRRKLEPRRKAITDIAGSVAAPVTMDPDQEAAALQPPDAEVRRAMLELEASARRGSELVAPPVAEPPPAAEPVAGTEPPEAEP
jgi:hypothetical protein